MLVSIALTAATVYARREPAQNVLTRRNGLRPETRPTKPRRDILLRDRDETETFMILSETKPRRDVSASRDSLETETSRPRPHL